MRATETSVKHCAQSLPSVGEKKALTGYSNRFITTSFHPFTSNCVFPQCKHLRDVDHFPSTLMAGVFKYSLNAVKHQRKVASTYSCCIPCSYICAFLHLPLFLDSICSCGFLSQLANTYVLIFHWCPPVIIDTGVTSVYWCSSSN